MYRRLKLRLALMGAASSGMVLALMAAVALALAQSQLNQRAWELFDLAASPVWEALSSGAPVDDAWLARAESAGGMLAGIETGGSPLLYTALRGRDASLFEKARSEAARRFGFRLEAPPLGHELERVRFAMSAPSGERFYAQAARVPAPGGWFEVVLLKSQSLERARVGRLAMQYAALVGLAVALLFCASYAFAARTLRPVEEGRRQQTQFVWAASHELRTPLAVIRSGLDAAEKAPAEVPRLLAVIGGQCGRMARLVEDMLELARADSRTWSIRFEDAQMETLLLCAAESFEAAAAGKGIALAVSLPQGVLLPCRCDPQRIGQVLAILLDNAVCYTPPGGRVTLGGEERRGGVLVRVADDGPGIPDEDKERVFERFYRADPARGEREHSGLGLSVAREIAALHHGWLRAGDTPGGGSTFSLWIPRRRGGKK